MRLTLIILGVIFLVIGGVLYYYPTQSLSAQTNTAGTGGTDVRTSSAVFSIPVEWSYASLAMGAILLLLGLVIPGPVREVQGPRGPRGRAAYSRRPVYRRSRRSRIASVTKTTRMK